MVTQESKTIIICFVLLMFVTALFVHGCTYVDMFAYVICSVDGVEEGATVTQLITEYEIGMFKRMGNTVFDIPYEESDESSSGSDDDDNGDGVEWPRSGVHCKAYKRMMNMEERNKRGGTGIRVSSSGAE